MRKFSFFILIFLLSSCYYTLNNTRLTGIHKIYIEEPKNNTSKYEIKDYLITNLNKLFLENSAFSIVSKKNADAILEIIIKEYKEEVASVDNDNNATSMRYVFSLSYKFYKGKNIIAKNDQYFFQKILEVKPLKNKEDELLKSVVLELSKELFVTVTEGF